MSFAWFDEINLVRSGCPLLCGPLTKTVSQGVGCRNGDGSLASVIVAT